MSLFTPVPLASRAKATRLSDLETNFRLATAVIGGTSYDGGVSTGSVPGSIGRDNIKPGRWLSRDRRTEPYSIFLCQGQLESVTNGTPASVAIPGPGWISDVGSVEVGFVFNSASAGAVSGTVAVSVCGTTIATVTFTGIAPKVIAYATTATAWTPSRVEALNMAKATVTVTTGGATLYDSLVFVFLKAKHIA